MPSVTVDDAAVSGDTLSASVSGFFVEKLLTDTAVTSDSLTPVAGLLAGFPDALVTSDTVTLTSDTGGFVSKFEGDSASSGETLTAHMVVNLTISDGAVSSDLVSKPRIPRLAQTSDLAPRRPTLVPTIPGGAETYAQNEMQRIQTLAENVLQMTPQASTQAPPVFLDGMRRLARNPWHPVAGQTVDAWVYYDAAAGAWVYEGTAPVTT